MRCRPICARHHRLGETTLRIALRPDLDTSDLVARLSVPRGKQSFSNWLRKGGASSPVGIGLLQEAAVSSGVPLPSQSPAALAGLINAVPVRLDGIAPIARAIFDAGGISFAEIDSGLMIRRLPGVFAAADARLGSADRRLSAAGRVRHGCCGGEGCVEVAGGPGPMLISA